MMPVQCASCKNYLKDCNCKAFPNGIPFKVLSGKHDHTKPFKGDNGIRFEPREEFKSKKSSEKVIFAEVPSEFVKSLLLQENIEWEIKL